MRKTGGLVKGLSLPEANASKYIEQIKVKQEKMINFSTRKVIFVSYLAFTHFVGLGVPLDFCELG